jgi:hypothetical protein
MINWLKGLPTWAQWTLGIFVLLVVIGAASGGGEESTDSSDNSSAPAEEPKSDSKPADEQQDEEPKEEEPKPEEPEDCGTDATDDCTPHVGPNAKVKVDALVWEIQSAETAPSIGDASIGFDEKANGVYVITNLKVTSTKSESVTISDDVVTLNVEGGNTYKSDSDGTFAAIGEGEDAFFLEDIGPDSTLNGVVVFDVPKNILGKKLELSFGELGFGSTTGFIQLPKL